MSKELARFIILGELPDLNSEINIAKSHWSKYSTHKRDNTEICKLYAMQVDREISDKVEIRFNWYCKNKRKDPDNIAFAKKYILDGIVASGMLSDDRWKNIGGFCDRFYIDKENPRIEVVIYKFEGEEN